MDYTPVIRAQISNDVKRLRTEIRADRLDGVSVGYLINSHKGMPVFSEGDIIEGLRVSIDRQNPRSVTLRGIRHAGIPLEDGEYAFPNREVTQSTTW